MSIICLLTHRVLHANLIGPLLPMRNFTVPSALLILISQIFLRNPHLLPIPIILLRPLLKPLSSITLFSRQMLLDSAAFLLQTVLFRILIRRLTLLLPLTLMPIILTVILFPLNSPAKILRL